MAIHPTAIIDAKAELASDVDVGPYSIIGPDVSIDSGTRIDGHVVIRGPSEIGKNNQFYSFSSIGEACQDKKYRGEPTKLIVGDHNVIREYVTLHRGTAQDRGETRMGHHNWIMAYVHIAHDCVVGNHTVFANNATLAGHVTVGDGVILGGFTGVHQFCQIGAYSMAGMFSVINMDVPAFVMVSGHPAATHGLNVEGMRRRGDSPALIRQLKDAYKIVYRQGLTLKEALLQLQKLPASEQLKLFMTSLEHSKRGIVR